LTVTFRRRVDNIILRWQGRLDGDGADRLAPYLVAGALFVVLLLLSVAQARSLDGTPDLAAYTQAAWSIRHGFAPVATVTTGSNIFAAQGAAIFYPLAQASRLVPSIPLLLTVQSAALAFAVVPLWRVCRRLANLRSGASLLVLLVYALYPIVQTLNLDGFRPETLALPFLIGAGYFGLTQHWRRFAACCLIAMLCRADLGLAVAGLGVLVMVQGYRRRGGIAVGVGLVWAFGFLLIVQPHVGSEVSQLQAYAAYGSTPWSVLWGMLTNPLVVLNHVFSHENFQLLVYLFAPVLFLPFLSPRYLLPVVPLQLIYLAGDVAPATRYGPQAVAITAFIFMATPQGLSRLGRRNVEKVTLDRRFLITMTVAALSFFVLYGPSSPYSHPWAWGSQDAADGARLDARDGTDVDARVRASESMLTLMAERRILFRLEVGSGLGPAPDAEAAATDVDVIIIDRREFGAVGAVGAVDGLDGPVGPIDRARERTFEASLTALGFHLVADAQDIVVLRR
jgi:uncharacterized membrane protein